MMACPQDKFFVILALARRTEKALKARPCSRSIKRAKGKERASGESNKIIKVSLVKGNENNNTSVAAACISGL